jgi:hypothetical protein
MLGRMQRKKEQLDTVGKNAISTNLMENSMRCLKNRKILLPYNPGIPLPGIYPKECKSGYNKDIFIPISC